jgi:hypothetical protein
MTKTSAAGTQTITTATYAKLINKSVRTARRRVAKLPNARKVAGVWQIELTASEVRAMRRKLVDFENHMTREIMAASWTENIDGLIAKKEAARDALRALGCGDLLLAIDSAKIWRGRRDAYGLANYRRALAEIDREVTK